MHDTLLILHDIRSAENVGSIFRTADAAGISKIYLTGYTPCPTDRFGRTQPKIHKSALGAETTVPWEHHTHVNLLITMLQKNGVRIVAVEQDKRATDYKAIRMTEPTAFIFGNEVTGIPQALLKKCDVVVEIPMKGKKESLNVSVAVGALLFRVLDI